MSREGFSDRFSRKGCFQGVDINNKKWALGINYSNSGERLQGNKIWIEDRGIKVSSSQIQISKRIGVDYAGNDAHLPYRFVIDYKS